MTNKILEMQLEDLEMDKAELRYYSQLADYFPEVDHFKERVEWWTRQVVNREEQITQTRLRVE